ncbi:MAG: phosphotransferase family protein [Myxococcota bacterium]
MPRRGKADEVSEGPSGAFRGWLSQRIAVSDLELSELEAPSHGGLSHETRLFRARWDDGLERRVRDLVLRLAPAGLPLFPRYDLEAQFRLQQILGERTELPVPRVLWLETDPTVLGRAFYVMERVPGRVASDVPPYLLGGWLHDATPAQQRRAQESLVDALARLHRLDWRKLGLDYLDRPECGPLGLDQEFGYWRRYLDWAGAKHPLPVLEAAFAWCLEHRPASTGSVGLSWGDARIGNVIYGDDFRPAALLDWEMACLGPPELDLGWMIFLHETALIWLEDLPGFHGREAILERYQQALGREVRDLLFYEVWAGLRAAAIRARIVQRDHVCGRVNDLRQQERTPVVQSLRRLIDLPRA